MKRILTYLLAFLPFTATAQWWPIGIVSGQDTLMGAQLGILSSAAVDGGKGIQLSGLTNNSGGSFKGVQLSGISNLAGGMDQGFQLAALLNASSGDMGGWQIGTFNAADSLSGAQIGLFNYARHNSGWQLGLVNLTRDTLPGVKRYGLININPKTKIDWMIFGGSQSKTNLAIRFRNRSTYNIFGIGTHYMGLDSRFSGAVYYRIGQYLQLSPKWSISGDLGVAHIETFEKSSSGKPQHLYALQARINADYQITKRLGAFASVGWGDTRYYRHAESYRSRPLIEAGLTIRRFDSNDDDPWQHTAFRKKRTEEQHEKGDITMAYEPKKHVWAAALEVTGINVGVHLMDRFILKEDFVNTTLNSLRDNFKYGMVWDNDFFRMNMFAHPYHGNLYFNAARANGLSYWESAPMALLGSAEWEFFGETDPPAINDLFATTCGGMAIGETFHRLSAIPLDDRARGMNRFLREAVATIFNPMQGLHRIISGDAWRVRGSHYRYHDFDRIPIQATLSTGIRYVADDGALFRGDYCPYVNLAFTYGTGADGEKHTTPFDFFEFDGTFSFGGSQPIVNNINILGRLWSTPLVDRTAKDKYGKSMYGEFGFFQHYSFYDSEAIKDGSSLVPYRIGEPASFGPGFMFAMEQPKAVLTRAEQRVLLSGILLGGTKTDYYNAIERDYNMGSGYSIKTKTALEFGNVARFTLNTKFWHLFTWRDQYDQVMAIKQRVDNGEFTREELSAVIDDYKAFEEKTGKDLRYLKAQGDKGNSLLWVINPMLDFHITKQWGIQLQGSYYLRHTHYKNYSNVHTHTFEVKLGATCRF